MICAKCKKEYFVLLNKHNRKVEALAESMHEHEINFIKAGNDVSYDRDKHKLHLHNCENLKEKK